MPGADDREMAMVKSRQLRFFETLDNGKHCGIDETKREIAVTVEQLADPAIVGHLDVENP